MPDLRGDIEALEWGATFPAQITARTGALYHFAEQEIAGDSALSEMGGGRSGDGVVSWACELNGAVIDSFPFLAELRYRGQSGDAVVYEFAAPGSGVVVGSPHTPTLEQADIPVAGYAIPAGSTSFSPTLTEAVTLPGLTGLVPGTTFLVTNPIDNTDDFTFTYDDPDATYPFLWSTGETVVLSPGKSLIVTYDGASITDAGGSLSLAGGGGGLELIHSSDNTDVATIDITGLTGHDTYLVEIYDCTATTAGGAVLWLRTSTDGGATFAAGAGDYTNAAGTASALLLTAASNAPDDDSTENALAMTVNVYGPGGATHPKLFRWLGGFYNNDITAFVSVNGAGKRNSTADVDALRLLMSTGNINARVRVYGVSAGGGGGGSGDVAGPASATDNRFARFDGVTGKLLKDSRASEDADGEFAIDYIDASTDTSPQVLNVYRKSSGTAADGIGMQVHYHVQTDSGAFQAAAIDAVTFQTAANATRKARRQGFVVDTAQREYMRAQTDGAQALLSFFGQTAVARQTGDVAAALVALGLMSGDPLAGLTVSELRLTLTTATPVTTGDVTAAGTIYLTPYLGNRIRLYTGGVWKQYATAELSLALSISSGSNYDVFLHDSAGTLTLETVAWTNDTTRATALTRQDGVWVKSGETNKLYVGSIRGSAANATEESDDARLVWNAFNRVPRRLRNASTSAHTYATATQRPWNNSTANRVEFLLGLAGESVPCAISGYSVPKANGEQANIGVGLDSTTATTEQMASPPKIANTGARLGVANVFRPGLGYHYLQALEIGDAAASEFNDYLLAGEVFA